MLFIKPHDGPALTAEQVKALDDEFFTARPLEYFSARIRSLLESQDSNAEHGPSTQEFLAALNLPATSPVLEVGDDDDRKLQVAVDSLTVRHHAAEALIRFLLGISAPRGDAAPFSTWASIVEGPTLLHEGVAELGARLDADEYLISRSLLCPGVPDDGQTWLVLATAWAWVRRAIGLLPDNELTVNAAHNKVKHGLAARARNDVRIEFVPEAGFDKDGNIPLSAFDASVPIFDQPALTYLARPYPRSQGLEVSSLLIEPPRVLAEAWMMAVVYSAMFHVAAKGYFGDREADIAPYPRLHLRPTPDELLAGRVRGYRGVLTTPLKDTISPRESGLFIGDTFTPLTIDFDGIAQSTIVDG